MLTLRKKMITLLSEEEHSARDLSSLLGIQEKEVYDHLLHVSRSVAAQKRTLVVKPCVCRSCGFVFKERKRFTKPGRCPECKGTYIESACFKIS